MIQKMKYDEEYAYTLGRIKELREAKGWTVQELAFRAEMERSNLKRIESGRTNMTYRTLFRLAEALQVKISDLVR